MGWLLWAILAVSLVYYLSSRRQGPGRLPPGPRPLPVIGNALDLRGGHLHHKLAELARTHGPVMGLRMGPLAAVVISSRDAAREALTKHDRSLAGRYAPDVAYALGWAGRSMIYLPSSDPLWKAQRGLVAAHAVSPRSLDAARGARERKVRDLLRHLRARAGQEVDIGRALYGCLINAVSSAFFSVDMVDLDAAPESAHGIREEIEGFNDLNMKANVSELFPFLRPLDLQGLRRAAAEHLRKIFHILDGIIEHRLLLAAGGKQKRHDDFLQVLLDLMSRGEIDRDFVKTIALDIFVTAADTTALTVEWAMAELLHCPSTMAKVRAEVDAALGSKEVVEEPEAMSLPYLQAVVKESMRLHPVGPLLVPHKAVEDGVEIGGYTVPKGCLVLINAWAIMRDPMVWDKPDQFVPERFLDGPAQEVKFRGKDFEFIPFGAGRRQCPGIPMAERVVAHVLASLLHQFEWRLPEGMSAEHMDVSEKFIFTNVLAVPLKAVPIVIRTT